MFLWESKSTLLASFSAPLKRLFRVNCSCTLHQPKRICSEDSPRLSTLQLLQNGSHISTCNSKQSYVVCPCPPPPLLITELEAKTVRGFEEREQSYYVRLGSLSTRLRKRAYGKALAKIQTAKQRSREFIAELNSTVDLVGLLVDHHTRSTSNNLHGHIWNVCFSRLNTAGRILTGLTRWLMTSWAPWWPGSPTSPTRGMLTRQR